MFRCIDESAARNLSGMFGAKTQKKCQLTSILTPMIYTEDICSNTAKSEIRYIPKASQKPSTVTTQFYSNYLVSLKGQNGAGEKMDVSGPPVFLKFNQRRVAQKNINVLSAVGHKSLRQRISPPPSASTPRVWVGVNGVGLSGSHGDARSFSLA